MTAFFFFFSFFFLCYNFFPLCDCVARKFILIFGVLVRPLGWSPSGAVIKCAVTGASSAVDR